MKIPKDMGEFYNTYSTDFDDGHGYSGDGLYQLIEDRFAFAGEVKLTEIEVVRLVGVLNSCKDKCDDDGNEFENEDVVDAMKYLQSKLTEASDET